MLIILSRKAAKNTLLTGVQFLLIMRNYDNIDSTMTAIMDILLTSKVLYLIAAGLGSLLVLSFVAMLALAWLERRVEAREI